ncbi:hypothetical protein [Hwangdonia lutea]|uniref:Uncharacterized protein n=1 Tax=Hwangdonia lutea TaxID=3075823 RepID=A0AA97HSU7_9FLAO|nr:hypothetical protein [Hwangdonia sp. SCSIO 19198]WOD44853.1 hypothetical protein RNZ46_06195 [Hwangdonia sp. SCSIO 19198]
MGVLGMKKYSYKTEKQIKNLLGGTVRWILAYLYGIILKKEKPKRKDFIFGPKKEEDYFGYTNTQHRNTISAIIASFLILKIIIKFFRLLF